MDRFEAIRNFRKAEDEKRMEEIRKAEEYRLSLVKKIETELAPRIKKMYEVAQELVANRIPLGKKNSGFGGGTSNCTDGINHRIGFYVKYPYCDIMRPDYTLLGTYGRENGGACGEIDLRIDCETGKIVEGQGLVGDMEWFIKGFDKAESDFYEYVDTTIGYTA